MPLDHQFPITYLITDGATTSATTPQSADFARLLELIERAVAARLSLVQIREKRLRPRVLYELTRRAAAITGGSRTRLLLNDRADIACAGGADGVHLTAVSLEARAVRRAFGDGFIIGVSTHSLAEAAAARQDGADFALLGPIFDTPSKRRYGAPLGVERLGEAATALDPFPLIAIGGVSLANLSSVLRAGARGIAAIRLFHEARDLAETVRLINEAGAQIGGGAPPQAGARQ
jgi:thiamine-phosphate pyrophosphorylase